MKSRKLIFYIILLCSIRGIRADVPPFTAAERNHVRVTTPHLFESKKEIEIHLDSLTEADYCFPLPGGKVISPYGRGGGKHSGTDIKTHAKDTIRAAFSGVVRMSKSYSAYGNVIVVRHNFGLETVYSHNVRNLVQSGDSVEAGQPIALVGRTGRATTEHLHFETRINGQHFNPDIILDLRQGTLRQECFRCTSNGRRITVKPLTSTGKTIGPINVRKTGTFRFPSPAPITDKPALQATASDIPTQLTVPQGSPTVKAFCGGKRRFPVRLRT